MSELLTPQRPAAASAAEAVALSRRHLWLLVVVTCVPVPALSYAAGVVPLPDLLTRAAVSFVPFIEATTGAGGGHVIRGESVAVESITIRSAGAVAGLESQRDRTLGDGHPISARVSVSAKASKAALVDKTSPRGGAGESTAPTAGVDAANDGETPTTGTEPDRTGDQQTPSQRGGAEAPADAAPPAPQDPPADPTTGSTGPSTKPGGGSAGGADPPKQGGPPADPGPASPPANSPATPSNPSPPEQASPPGKPPDAGSQGNGSGGGRP
jgi:hypothetical protein